MIFDIVIVGAGPVGLALACGFANTKLKVAIIDKLSKKILVNPAIDGREIALTHHSANILKKIGVWNYIPNELISVITNLTYLTEIISQHFRNTCKQHLPQYFNSTH